MEGGASCVLPQAIFAPTTVARATALMRPFVEGFLSRILCVFGVVINTPVMTDGGLSVSPDDR